jgi:hypothetical protein
MIEVHKNVLSQRAIADLLNYLEQTDDTTDARPDFLSKHPEWVNPAQQQATWPQHHLQEFFDTVLKDYIVDQINFVKSDIRYPLHADTALGNHDDLELYKGIIVPLKFIPPYGTPFFDNHWFGRSAKFTRQPVDWYGYELKDRHGGTTYIKNLKEFRQQIDNNVEEVHKDFVVDQEFIDLVDYLISTRDGPRRNQIISDYKDVINTTDEPFPDDVRLRYFDHVPLEDCQGLKFGEYVEWNLGDIIVWDRSHIHATGPHSLGKHWIFILTYQRKQ